jgi:hypothetical protein
MGTSCPSLRPLWIADRPAATACRLWPVSTIGDPEWRLEVGRTRAAHPRRALPFTVNVGRPAGARVTAILPWPPPPEYDAGLRFDLLDALVEQWQDGDEGDDRAYGWLTRPGVPSVHDEDLRWFAATTRAAQARELRLVAFRAVTHTGWLDVATGERTTWRRLRL